MASNEDKPVRDDGLAPRKVPYRAGRARDRPWHRWAICRLATGRSGTASCGPSQEPSKEALKRLQQRRGRVTVPGVLCDGHSVLWPPRRS
jgi:hypothetical protein